jgi:hypothetical protein
MAWSTVPAEGSQYGPCAEPCQHRDCAQHRADAQVICSYCHKAVGTDTPIYSGQDGESRLVHASCLEDAIAKEQGA